MHILSEPIEPIETWIIMKHWDRNGVKVRLFLTDGGNLGYQPWLAKQFPTAAQAEAFAFAACLADPQLLGVLSVRKLTRRGIAWDVE